MILPYYFRLVCLCFATFFVTHALCWLLIRSIAPAAVRIAGTLRPRSSTRLLFGLRMAPSAVGLFLVIGFCVPSYIWLEPPVQNERVGLACLLVAVLGAMGWAISLSRGFVSMVRTARYVRAYGRRAAETSMDCNLPEVFLVTDGAAVMAVAGVLGPRLVVSESVMNALNREETEAAFRHEASHRASRDNLKKLLFLLSPDVLPFLSGLA